VYVCAWARHHYRGVCVQWALKMYVRTNIHDMLGVGTIDIMFNKTIAHNFD
jgi:hypothetical protein